MDCDRDEVQQLTSEHLHERASHPPHKRAVKRQQEDAQQWNKYRQFRIAQFFPGFHHPTLEQAKANSDSAYKKLQEKYKKRSSYTTEEVMNIVTELQLCHDVSASVHKEMKGVADQLDDLGNREAVKRDAVVARNAAASQQELFVGNRQYVSQFKGASKAKILDVPNWSWGLNCAWVEGGISARAHYTVKVDEDNQYTQIPEAVQQAISGNRISAEDFISLCRKHGRGSLLWYDKDGANRPTWTALEMATLLRAGYTFRFGEVISLTPPQ